nr:hypothetical protein [Tanacetum cinerariifolium]
MGDIIEMMMEEYMRRNRTDNGVGEVRPKIGKNVAFEIKGYGKPNYPRLSVRRILLGFLCAFVKVEIFSIVTSMCCDDAYPVTSRVFVLSRCDRLVSEPLVIEKRFVFLFFLRVLYRPTGYSISKDFEEESIKEEPLEEPKEEGK